MSPDSMLKWAVMIPVRLSVHNFMCYRDNVPPLHFAGIHTASICGNNGNGKSALIDAVTWAIWGQTRARRDDDLIHTGQPETAVEFDFAVGDQTYRILRRHSRPRRRGASGQSSLEFQLATEEGFRPITGNTIQHTQQKIIDTLHMDYGTFTNSAFLRQGHADEFTTANPARRKQVLSSILGLSLYDDLEARARELVRRREGESEQLEGAIRDIDEELAHKPAYETEARRAEEEVARLKDRIAEAERRLTEQRRQAEALKARQWQLSQISASMGQRRRNLEQWSEQLSRQQSRVREHESIIGQRQDIDAGYARLVDVRQQAEDMERKLRRTASLEKQKADLDMEISRASQSLLREHAVAQQRISDLETRSGRLPELRGELQQARHRMQHLEEEEQALQSRTKEGQDLRARLHSLGTSRAQISREIQEIGEKLDMLTTEHGARCPLCETELGTDGLRLIERKYTDERRQKAESLSEADRGLASGKTALKAADEEIAGLQARLRKDRESVQGRIGLLAQQTSEAEHAARETDTARANLTEIEERLARRDFATAQQQMHARIERELADIGYDRAGHDEVSRRLEELRRYDEPKRKLEEADRLIEEERQAIARSLEAIDELRAALQADEEKKEDLSREISRLAGVAEGLAAAEDEFRALSERQQRAREQLGNIRGRLDRCAELEQRRRERTALLSRSTEEEGIYRELTEAFGKKGIQALLIETALPEIETEANRLLGRMTDNRMHVKIETQRETRKGDTVETLDINIADELGTRDYEMFSGGEAFRINFAIRIALSKLLARRAGAPLSTLIIDEGFGTQDSIGIEKLREAINSIQDDFHTILVITHIEELRDAFPARIDIAKGPEGSTISLG